MTGFLITSRPAVLCLLLASVILNTGTALRAADASSLVAEAKTNLQSGRTVEALAFAKEAVRANPADYRAHYYVAYAYVSMEKFDEAEAAAQESLRHATDETKPTVEKLIATISRTRDALGKSNDLVKAGDDAFNKGLAARAAEFYRRAFLASPTRGEVGLKAATIYADRLDELMEAAAIWNRIAAAGDEGSAAQARDKLAQHAKALDELVREKSAQPTLPNLLKLVETFPERAELQLSVAALYAREGDIENTVKHLAESVKHGTTISQVSVREEFRALLARAGSNSQLETFLTDAFGPTLAIRMKEQTRQEQAREQAKAAEVRRQRESRVRQEQLRAAEAKKQRDMQEQQERAVQAKRQAEEEFIRKSRALEK